MSYSFVEAETLLNESIEHYGFDSVNLRFIIDAQLPRKLCDFIKDKDFFAIHTMDLPDKNATTDSFINKKSIDERLILITKDDDFLRSFLIQGRPYKLIMIKTGNISNQLLMEIFDRGFSVIVKLINKHRLLEITKSEIIVHN